MQKLLLLVLSLVMFTGLAKADDTDLYPKLPVANGKVPKEYAEVHKAFDRGDRAPTNVLGALAIGNHSCTYYLADFNRKEDAPLDVSPGHIGHNSRSLTVLGTRVQLMMPKSRNENGVTVYDGGPWLQLDLPAADHDTMRYQMEVRLGTGDAEGSFIISILSGLSSVDRWFAHPQFLVCDVR